MRVLHYLNQFFAGFGGERFADLSPRVIEGPVGPGRALQQLMGKGDRVVATLVCGDDAFARDPEASLDALAALARGHEADVLVAGPAFNAGRYGMACMQVGARLGERLGIPAVTAMSPDNPAVVLQARGVFTLPTEGSAVGMDDALARLARFTLRLARGEEIGAAEVYGFLPRGRRVNVLERKSAAVRAVELLMTKLHGYPASSEIPLPSATEWHAAAHVANVATARIALVTEGGIVPRGNPDRIESRRATRWRKYPIRELDRLPPEGYECVHAGFDTHWVGADPHRVLPLDVVRDLEREGRIGALHDHYYVTVGCGTTVEAARSFGEEIARDLVGGGVRGVVMTAT
jgi:glycine reductase